MKNVLLVDLGTPRDEISEPLGIETLAPYVEAALGDQVSVDVKSLELDNLETVQPYLEQKKYAAIGLSTKIRAYDKFQRSMAATMHYASESKVFIGDILATYAYDDVLGQYPEVICVRGEGEESFPLALKAVFEQDDARLEGISNLAFIRSGRLVETERAPFDVKKALLPKRLLTQEVLKQHGIGRLEASRGCAYANCGFCGVIEKYAGREWKPFPLEFILQDLTVLSELGFISPYFTDEDFFGNDTDRVTQLAGLIGEGKRAGNINRDINLYINLRANSILGVGFGGEEEAVKLLTQLKVAGLREVFVGIESGCKDQLAKRYTKGVTKQKNIRAINILRDLGLEVDLGFIFFDEDSELPELRENLNFIYEANIARHDCQLIKRLRVEPRTPIGVKFAATHPSAKIDLNAVEYPYRFKSAAVEAIFYTFCEWQRADLDVIYNLQAFCRGEIPSGYSRQEVKGIISQYRELDVQFLDAVIAVFEDGQDNKDGRVREVIKEFAVHRNTLDSFLAQRVYWLNSNFRRFKT
ncbi:hypothetical protein GYA13_00530 [Candidatus Kuenenbacteria bacterium]|nr:hypothetical protein [Candidatus Kuenenbacteria bacterium]